MNILKNILRYPGGKSKAVEKIIAIIPTNTSGEKFKEAGKTF
jgi:hypothetical protein